MLRPASAAHPSSPYPPNNAPSDSFMSEGYFRLLMEESQMAYFDYDVDKDHLCISVSMLNGERETRRYPGFLKTLKNMRSIPEDLRQGLLETARRIMTQPGKSSFSISLDLQHSGEYRWHLVFINSLPNHLGRVNRVIGRLRDVQAEKLTELRLQNMSIYRHAVGRSSLFVFEFDLPHFAPRAASATSKVNESFYPLENYLCCSRQNLIHPDDVSVLQDFINESSLLEAFHSQRYGLESCFRILNRSSQWIWVRLAIHLSHGCDGSKVHGIGYMQIIQDRVALEERARLDAITGLLNRGATEEQINCTLSCSSEVAYFFIFDVDNFKSINDSQGHAGGDQLLRMIATTLKAHLRKTDLLGRIGGDEYVALLTGLNSNEQAAAKATELLNAVQQIQCPADWQGRSRLSISIGIARAPHDGLTFDALYRKADCALYKAKGSGKNQFCLMD